MKNLLIVDIDSDRTDPGPIVIGKPANIPHPTTQEEFKDGVRMDIGALCEALCTLIHLAEDQGIRSSAESLRICQKHLVDGFADASYETQSPTKPSETVKCPFCGEGGFDLIGLKNHFRMGWCEPFDNTRTLEQESAARRAGLRNAGDATDGV